MTRSLLSLTPSNLIKNKMDDDVEEAIRNLEQFGKIKKIK
jgi:hypothetical protein